MSNIQHPLWTGALFISTLLVAVRLAPVIGARSSSHGGSTRPPLTLVPKAKLSTEAARWTFAPAVPPPIQRTEPKRVVVNWSIKEGEAEVAPGVIYDDYWGFEGRVPGPLLRVREGDMVEIHLTNGLQSKNAHNIDFHFVSGPGGGASALNVMPGETAVLEARAMAPGLYMFHCASPDIPVHIANGMYGFVLVEPAEGLPPVDKEFYVVQSEIYAHNGDKGHQHFDMERGEKMDPQYVVFNGAVGSMLKDNAPHVKLNERVRMYVGNAGPNLVSSFHVIGQIFDNVYREGDLISAPAHGLQTTLIPAGGSTVVEFKPQVPGSFLMVDHAIFRLHHGAAGSVVVDGDIQLAREIYTPITKANAPEMSADAHLGHGDMHSAESAPSAPPQPPGSIESAPAAPVVSLLASPAYGIPPAAPPLTIVRSAGATAPVSPAPANPSIASGKAVTVTILEGAGIYNAHNTYSPKQLTIKRGTTVTWVNNDPNMVHNLGDVNHTFTSTYMRTDQKWSYTFKKPGVYHYYCLPHPWMKGEIRVQ